MVKEGVKTPLVDTVPSSSYQSIDSSKFNTTRIDSIKSGHEQSKAVQASLVLLVTSIIIGLIFGANKSHHWSWNVVTTVQTLFAFLLPVAYPGYGVLTYSLGLGNDGPATRFETFYIESTMGMVLGVSHMAFLDHLMFVFAPIVIFCGWMPFVSCQVIASALACLCGLYMYLWVPTNEATNTQDPGPYILCSVFTICSFSRVIVPSLTYERHMSLALFVFNCIICTLVFFVVKRAEKRRVDGKATHCIALVQWMCEEIGEGPIWQLWPTVEVDSGDKVVPKDFPSGWWFEPTPFGSGSHQGLFFGMSSTGSQVGADRKYWPYGEWPTESAESSRYDHLDGYKRKVPPSSLVSAAQEEMLREIPDFLRPGTVLLCLMIPILSLVITSCL